MNYRELAASLRGIADHVNDAADHDELHAAGEIAAFLNGDTHDRNYIDRWLVELEDRFKSRGRNG